MKQRNNATTQQRNNATTQQRNNFKYWKTSSVFLFLILVFSSLIHAQETLAEPEIHYYYIEEASYDLLKPTNIITKEDRTLKLEFDNDKITAFFDDFIIYSYMREFEWSQHTQMHKYYLIQLDSEHKESDLLALDEIVYSEYVGELEGELFGTPNDYDASDITTAFYPHPQNGESFSVSGINANEHLELVKARQAWNITTGNPNIVIGVKDRLFYNNHPDLIDKIFASEIPVWSDEGEPGAGNSHGVNVMGAAAADTNNGIGIAAIGYDSSLFPIAGMSRHGATLFLAENYPSVKVVNISSGFFTSNVNNNGPQQEAYELAWDFHNVTVVAAAGNGFITSSSSTSYAVPASYDNVISVSSVGSQNEYGTVGTNEKMYDWKDVHELHIEVSNSTFQHNDKVDLVAPGYSVATTNGHDEYRVSYGTSYSSPMVAGTVALMYDVYPTITPDEVRDILKATADDISHIPENDPYIDGLGAGRLNAYAAVLMAKCEFTQESGLDLI
ncbi:MAG: S8 family serine peptidase, partial [Flavobacteriaceae bacterium]|nr:S8 family serine peptidase [Flavobacteriaceae bacterium]